MALGTPEYKKGEMFTISTDSDSYAASDFLGVYVALDDIDAKRIEQVAGYADAAHRNGLTDVENGQSAFIAKMKHLGLIGELKMRSMYLQYEDRKLKALDM